MNTNVLGLIEIAGDPLVTMMMAMAVGEALQEDKSLWRGQDCSSR